MPQPPAELTFLQSARDDLMHIQQHNPDHAERILRKINDWTEKIRWGRVPQQHLEYLTGSDHYNFYRERVGNAGYRVIYNARLSNPGRELTHSPNQSGCSAVSEQI